MSSWVSTLYQSSKKKTKGSKTAIEASFCFASDGCRRHRVASCRSPLCASREGVTFGFVPYDHDFTIFGVVIHVNSQKGWTVPKDASTHNISIIISNITSEIGFDSTQDRDEVSRVNLNVFFNLGI